jgi:hypothetical protein
MRWSSRFSVAFAVLMMALVSAPALADDSAASTGTTFSGLRNIPPQARSATLGAPYGDRSVALNGKLFRLAPGAQIRDARNLLVLPMNLPNLPDGIKVRYQLDINGDVFRLWMLTPEEAGAKVDSQE